MAFDWSQLITPAFMTAAATGLGKMAQNLLNHKVTENFEAQTKALTAVIEKGNAEIKRSSPVATMTWSPPFRN